MVVAGLISFRVVKVRKSEDYCESGLVGTERSTRVAKVPEIQEISGKKAIGEEKVKETHVGQRKI